ncbi:TlpA family protein disulfide reductase [Nakamurella deserti]|uniref:TlpA family protein disulfide reductase n=1 Tax=Nakamurella deserti TaxID=2164074 RepID=UPI000DBE59DF|nr:TlpA disulfide reductase family protein [Nakamurella deserti]
MRRILTAIAAATALVVSGCTSNATAIPGNGAFVFVSPGGKSEFTYAPGERGTVEDFTGSSVTDAGQTIKLSDYAGKIMVLNVWGSWCVPCRAEAEDLEVAAELSAGDPVQFLGINIRDDRQAAADFMAARAMPFPSIYDPTTRTLLSMSGLPTSSIPTTIVLDREHKVAKIYLRVVEAQELDEAVDALVAEGGDQAAGVPDPAPTTAPSVDPTTPAGVTPTGGTTPTTGADAAPTS